jgi:hypothetical protein
MKERTRQFHGVRMIVALVAVLCLVASVQPVSAADAERVQLGIKPVGIDGSYFDLTMKPGEARQLTVELGNFGTRDAVAQVYPADVYSLVNGGMGVRLAGEPTSGATGWLGIAAESLPLAASEGQVRSFPVSVPDGAGPGEYITSIVIQDATPAEGVSTGGVVATRVNRQAIAVAITVPGPITPGLTLGAVGHHVASGKSVMTVDVANTGNVRLKPSGEFVLSDRSGAELTRFPIAMDSVYAGTSTVAEIPFTTLLDPGDYVATLSLADSAHDVAVTTSPMALTIDVPAAPVPAQQTSAPRAVVVRQSAGAQIASAEQSSIVLAVEVAVVTLLAGGAVGWAATRFRAGRQSVILDPVPAPQALPVATAPTVIQPQPVNGRPPMIGPTRPPQFRPIVAR